MILIVVFAVLRPLQESPGGGVFPYAVYVVPNALFPLMTYFLWIRFSLYKPYIALYIAGKTIGVVSIIGWCIFSFRFSALSGAVSSVFAMEQPGILIAGIILILAALDGLTIFGGLLLNTKVKRTDTAVKAEVT
ncbi:MAG: hypothetical protein LBG87_01520 [Spirochaetaceae bacterium]|nr:hypothetical protein [Spirochaetaceae bacterium]